jgi:hypothetical protein
MGVCTALFMKLVNKNWAGSAIISTMSASVRPAALTAANSSSVTLPRFSISALAKATATCRFGSLDRPCWFSAISSGCGGCAPQSPGVPKKGGCAAQDRLGTVALCFTGCDVARKIQRACFQAEIMAAAGFRYHRAARTHAPPPFAQDAPFRRQPGVATGSLARCTREALFARA